MSEASNQPRTGSGLPPGAKIGESWADMLEELGNSRRQGLVDSVGRRIIERLGFSDFTELGRLVGTGFSDYGDRRVPGEVIAGWGHCDGRPLFVVADEASSDLPRNPAGATMARNVLFEANRRGAPYVSVACARRWREDLRGGKEFGRVGLQIDFDLELETRHAIPKVLAICGTVDLAVLLEAAAAHYVIAGPNARAVLPDDSVLETADLARLGWIDVCCTREQDVVEHVLRVLPLLADSSSAGIGTHTGTAVEAGGSEIGSKAPPAEIGTYLADPGTLCQLCGLATGSLTTSLARIKGRVVGLAIGDISDQADTLRLTKLRRICRTFHLPVVVVQSGSVGRTGQPRPSLSLSQWDEDVILVRGCAGASDSEPVIPGPYLAILQWTDIDLSDSDYGGADAVIAMESTRSEIARMLGQLGSRAERTQKARREPPKTEDALFG